MKSKLIIFAWASLLCLQTGAAAYQKFYPAGFFESGLGGDERPAKGIPKPSEPVAKMGEPANHSSLPPEMPLAQARGEQGNSVSKEAGGNRGRATDSDIVAINKISPKMAGEIVTIIGKVESLKHHEKGHVFLTVSDTTGQIAVPILAYKGIDKSELETGRMLKITGKVSEYKGKLEVVPAAQEDVLPWKEAPKAIGRGDIGKDATLTGKVVSKYEHPEGHIFLTVMPEGGRQEIEVPIFKSLGYSDPRLKVNSRIRLRKTSDSPERKLPRLGSFSYDSRDFP